MENKVYYIASAIDKEDVNELQDMGYNPISDSFLAFQHIVMNCLNEDSEQPIRVIGKLLESMIRVIDMETCPDDSEMNMEKFHELDGFDTLDAMNILLQHQKITNENQENEIMELERELT